MEKKIVELIAVIIAGIIFAIMWKYYIKKDTFVDFSNDYSGNTQGSLPVDLSEVNILMPTYPATTYPFMSDLRDQLPDVTSRAAMRYAVPPIMQFPSAGKVPKDPQIDNNIKVESVFGSVMPMEMYMGYSGLREYQDDQGGYSMPPTYDSKSQMERELMPRTVYENDEYDFTRMEPMLNNDGKLSGSQSKPLSAPYTMDHEYDVGDEENLIVGTGIDVSWSKYLKEHPTTI